MRRPRARSLRDTTRFNNIGLCQYDYTFDRGSMVQFNLGVVPVLEAHGILPVDGKEFGWLQQDYTSKFTTSVWQDLLFQVALGTTILAEGESRTAAGEVKPKSIVADLMNGNIGIVIHTFRVIANLQNQFQRDKLRSTSPSRFSHSRNVHGLSQ